MPTPDLSREPLILATHNKGKVREFARLLQGRVASLTTAGEMGLPEPEETGSTFVDNALIKARAAWQPGRLVLADDSGLCVHALNGDPGLYSSRWAGPAKDFALAQKRVHDALGDAADRSAHFIAVLALKLPDGQEKIFEGRIDGSIAWPPRGDKGHGYDPVFQPHNDARTFAEMTEDEKNAISHRGRSLAALLKWLEE